MIRTLTLLVVITLSFGVKAQPLFEIGSVADSANWFPICNTPAEISYWILGSTDQFNPSTDSISLYTDFGDGTTATFSTFLYTIPVGTFFGGNAVHTYTAPGIYQLQFIMSGYAQGVLYSDTAYSFSVVGDDCEDIGGAVYADNNENCTFESGEPGVLGVMVDIEYQGSFVARTWTNSSGVYNIGVPAGTSYDIVVDVQDFPYHCPASTIQSVGVPSVANDIGVNGPGVSINEHAMEQISLYPNPASNSVKITCEDNNAVLSIFDMSGRRVHSQMLQAGSTNIDITEFDNGTYILRVDDGTKMSVNRLVKMD